MFILKGKYNIANIYADIVDETAVAQITELLNRQFAEGAHIAIMPDVHAGAGCVIGTTMTIKDKVVPNLVGVDIGCGMETVELCETDVDFEKLDRAIYEKVPSGFEIRKKPHRIAKEIDLSKLYCAKSVNIDKALCSIGTLGGGNHFIEMDRGENGQLYLVIHSGSRHLGIETAKFYQNAAYESLSKPDREKVAEISQRLKEQGRQAEIPSALKQYLEGIPKIPKELAYCEGELFDRYIHDMKIVQRFAALNRQAMSEEIIGALGLNEKSRFTTVHNYIDTENMILRKGSVSAQKGEKLLIPINMRDGSLICVGKGNPEYNFSAPHGAGRLYSRSQAKESFSVEEYARQMEGIYTTSVGASTLDECPMAYKSLDEIVENLGETVEITQRIKPVYNFKAGVE